MVSWDFEGEVSMFIIVVFNVIVMVVVFGLSVGGVFFFAGNGSIDVYFGNNWLIGGIVVDCYLEISVEVDFCYFLNIIGIFFDEWCFGIGFISFVVVWFMEDFFILNIVYVVSFGIFIFDNILWWI